MRALLSCLGLANRWRQSSLVSSPSPSPRGGGCGEGRARLEDSVLGRGDLSFSLSCRVAV